MPIDGKILELNEALEKSPELVNSDPFGEGWLIKISVNNASQVGGLLSAEEYSALVG
jgi:glycine cleavage system H protein